MGDASLWNRIPHGVTSLWHTLQSVLGSEATPDAATRTTLTFRAVADAVVPRTPDLADELGREHAPGGQAIGLGDFLVDYVNALFQFGLPGLGPCGNLPLARPVADALDTAALALLEDDGNEDEPHDDRVVELFGPGTSAPAGKPDATGPFARLSREDRLRALGRLDEIEIELRTADGEPFEFDAGLVGQLVVGFTEMIYYSEWQGYEGFDRPPSELTHPNDPAAVQSWRQTGYPGFAPGYAALRGYLGTDDGPLGGGDVWTTLDEDGPDSVRVFHDSGSFRENDYDTSDYEEPFPEDEAARPERERLRAEVI